MTLFLKYAPLAFSALLPVVNPIGSALIFLSLTGAAPLADYRWLARKVAFSTAVLLIVVDLLGARILGFFGISLPVVELAGGCVLAAMGWGLLNQKDVATPSAAPPAVPLGGLDEKVFYPLTFPVTAGPGCIVVAVTLSAHAARTSTFDEAMAHLGIVAAICVICVLVYFCYAFAPALTRKVSPQTTQGWLRIIAFILLCIGAQIAWNGLSTLLHGVAGQTWRS